MVDKKIGSRIKELRKEKGLTQKELSEISGVHEIQIARYENSKSVPTLQTIKNIAKALDVKIDDIIGVESFNSGDEFEKRWNELITKNVNGESLTIVHNIYNEKMEKLMSKLNKEGKVKAIEQVELLTMIERYTKD